LADASFYNYSLIENSLTSQAIRFASRINAAYALPLQTLNAQLAQVISSTTRMNNSITNTSDILTSLNANFTAFRNYLASQMRDYMNNHAGTDFPAMATALGNEWDANNTQPAILNLTDTLYSAFNDPVSSFAPLMVAIENNSTNLLNTLNSEFHLNESNLNSAAIILSQEPTAYFQNTIGASTVQVSKFAEFGCIWRYGLGSASAQIRVKQGHFFHFSFLR
jgi:hypothetical protein